MSYDILKIASLITEDPDIFDDYKEKFRENTTLDEEIFGDIVAILKQVAEDSGLVLDHRRLKVRFNPAGLTVKNIYLDCIDPEKKAELVARVADSSGDDNIKHNFAKNLRVNYYLAINREFADRVRQELNLEVTHQSTDPEDNEDSSELMPMATFTQPATSVAEPEQEVSEPMGTEPEGGPEPSEAMPGPQDDFGLGGGGLGGGSLGGPPEELGAPEEPLEEPEGAEPEVGPFGVEAPGGEAPEGEAEEAPPPEEGEEDDMLAFEDIQRIANLIDD